MLERFISYVRENNVLDLQSYYLLAISGGKDSVVLAHLLKNGGFKFGLVHCNFQLRGEESDKDEEFIRDFAEKLGVSSWTKKFDTKDHMAFEGVSLQMAARDLRYVWFEELYKELKPSGILVAHHADDQLETIMLNLLRGTGIEGIYGMAGRRDYIIRPLLPFRKEEIEDFLFAQKLEWREDESNQKDEYRRNFIRHHLLPEINEYDPKAADLMRYSFERIKGTGKAFFYLFDQWKLKSIKIEEDYEYLSYLDLEGIPGEISLLYYWLKEKGFSYVQALEVLEAKNRGEVGKHFLVGDWMLNLDRERFILGPIEEGQQVSTIENYDISISINGITYEILTLDPEYGLDKSTENVMLDKSMLQFPLTLRNWQQGDRFRPLGMSKFKKISDFLIDLKVPLIKKGKVKVLCSENQVVWLVGYRVDDRFKVSPATQKVLYLKRKKDV